MPKDIKTKREVVRVAGKLKEIVTVRDEKGNILQKIMRPLMVEFYPRDMIQVMIGAAILAVPVGFTEETWNLGETLPLLNVFVLFALSLIFISVFVFYNYYRGGAIKKHFDEFIKRVLSTYFIAFFIVAILLTIIQRTPWTTDWILAFKRVVIVAFPSSMSAAVADIIK